MSGILCYMALTVAKLPDIVTGDSFTQVLAFASDTRDWRGVVLTSEVRKVTKLGPRLDYLTVKTFVPTPVFYAAPDYSKFRVVMDATAEETASWGLGQLSGKIVVEQDGYGKQTLGAYNFNGVLVENAAIGLPRPDVNIVLDTPDNITFVYEGIGIKGDKGERGEQGEQGIQGVPGGTGGSGVQGEQGPQGPAGPVGPQGVPGIQGVAGNTGERGTTGAKGDNRDQGERGYKGDPGPRGDAGLAGAVGAKGDTGATGAQGATGATGAKGDKGDTGDIGLQGLKGDKGDQGEQGLQGVQGIQGIQGVPGTSPEAATGSLTFVDEEGYVEATVTDANIHAGSNLIVGLVSSEDAAIQGINVGVVSVSEGSAVIYGGAPRGATGTFNVNIHIV